MTRWFFLFAFLIPPCGRASGTNFAISGFSASGQVTWSNAFNPGVCTVETTFQPGAANGRTAWAPQQNYFTTNSDGAGNFPMAAGNLFLRLRAVDFSANSPLAFTNFAQSFGLLHTLAGSGADAGTDNVNYWKAAFEGGYATNAALSRPHFALDDGEGNILIVDKNSHSVLKVTTDGRIHTIAGTHAAGNGTDSTALATDVAMNQPNGIWRASDGTLYILDTGNSKVRRLDVSGTMTTLFTDGKGINIGRGLWVNDDGTLAYYSSGSNLREWTADRGTSTLNKQFTELGNLIMSGTNIVATDRGSNTVWLIKTNDGSRALLFGNGRTNRVFDGTLAATNSLFEVRGVWQPPTGGYLLATDQGSQLLYVDLAGIIHVLLDGGVNVHAGDGQWFYAPGKKVSELRSVSMDSQGDVLVVENDVGYVRRLDFKRLLP